MKQCMWDDCNENVSGELDAGNSEDRVEGYEGYCKRHFRKALAARDPELRTFIEKDLVKPINPKKAEPVKKEGFSFDRLMQQVQGEGYAAGSVEALKHRTEPKPFTGKTTEDGYVVLQDNRKASTPHDDLNFVDAFRAIGNELVSQRQFITDSLGGNAGAIGDFLRKNKGQPVVERAPMNPRTKKWLWIGVGCAVLLLIGWWGMNTIVSHTVAETLAQQTSAQLASSHAALPNISSTFDPTSTIGVYGTDKWARTLP